MAGQVVDHLLCRNHKHLNLLQRFPILGQQMHQLLIRSSILLVTAPILLELYHKGIHPVYYQGTDYNSDLLYPNVPPPWRTAHYSGRYVPNQHGYPMWTWYNCAPHSIQAPLPTKCEPHRDPLVGPFPAKWTTSQAKPWTDHQSISCSTMHNATRKHTHSSTVTTHRTSTAHTHVNK